MKNIVLLSIFVFTPMIVCGQFFSQRQFNKEKRGKENQPNSLEVDEKNDTILMASKKKQSFVLRKSLSDYFADVGSKKAKEGALFSFTAPKDKTSSIVINAGANYTWNKVYYTARKKKEHEKKSKTDTLEYKLKYTKYSFGPKIQLDRNTLVDKEQDNLLIGMSYLNNFIDYFDFKEKKYNRRLNAPFKVSAAYRKDRINELKSFQFSLYLSPQLNSINKDGELVRDDFIHIKKETGFKIITDLKLGFEYDYLYSNPSNDLNGNFLRTYSKIMIGLGYNKTFSTTLAWQYRRALIKPIGLTSNDYTLFIFRIDATPKIGFKDDFFKSISPTLSIIHENGENPSKGFLKQSYWAIALSLAI